MKYFLSIFTLGLLISSCTPEPTAETILAKAIEAHGGNKIANSHVSFDFRDKHYKANYVDGNYTLSRHFSDTLGNKIIDKLTNSSFERYVNDTTTPLTDEWASKYSNSVNSVFYFFRLPHNLQDPAAILTYIGKGSIDGVSYNKIKVAFSEEGGGEDFDDLFVYWFNAEIHTLDYFAYEYATSGGGKRFRKAFNQRDENGLLVSDFINYKPKDLKVSIEEYDTYFSEKGLIKLSEIVNRNVKVTYN